MTIFSRDELLVGLHTATITGIMESPLQKIEQSFDISLFLDIDCTLDVVTPLASIDNQSYLIAVDKLQSFAPTWLQSKPDCPVTYEIMKVVSGAERPLTASELRVITFQESDGSMSYSTNDFDLDGKIWTLSIKMKSTFSKKPDVVQYVFDIRFRDSCWEANLVPAEF